MMFGVARALARGASASAVQRAPASLVSAKRHRQKQPRELYNRVLDSIVRIGCVAVSPNYLQPWTVKAQRESSGSGFIIDGRRILTNAHVVADQSTIFVRSHGSPHNYTAKVVAVGHECDLALLSVEDEQFWRFVGAPMHFGDLPNLHDEVTVAGYPIGGDTISLSNGVVSRVELQQYSHGATFLLAMQIDAAINPGNSGGPVLSKDGHVVGVAFQALMGGDNVGYVIPRPVIGHFLRDIETHGRYTGFCQLGLSVQWLDNQQMRRFYRMTPEQTGVAVSRLLPLYPAHAVMKPRDILTAIDGTPIGNDATIPFRQRERVMFDHVLLNKFPGDKLSFSIIREGHSMETSVTAANIPPLVNVHEYDRHPSFFIYAGLVFMVLAQPYLHEWGEHWLTQSPRRLVEKALNGHRRHWDEQVVILSRVLSDEINFGFQRFSNLQVMRFNGQSVRNLKHLHDMVMANGANEYDIFELEDEFLISLNHADAVHASARILERHRVPANYASHLPPPPSQPSEWKMA